MLGSIQTQLQMKRKSTGRGGGARRDGGRTEDLRVGKTAWEGNKKKQMRGTMKSETKITKTADTGRIESSERVFKGEGTKGAESV